MSTAFQKNIGIISECNSVKVGKAGQRIRFTCDVASSFVLLSPGGYTSGSGPGGGSIFNVTAGRYTYTNTNLMNSIFRLNATMVPATIYSSYFPICGYTNNCNNSPVYNTSSTRFLIKHFNNNVTAYRYNIDGQYYKMRQGMASNAVLGVYYQFTVSPTDFIIVEDAITSNQYHLSAIHGGFYDFSEFPPCLNQLPNIRNLALEPIQAASTSVQSTTILTTIEATTIETTIETTTVEKTIESTIETTIETTLTEFHTSITEIFNESTAPTISKRTRAFKTLSVYESYSFNTSNVFTLDVTVTTTISLSQEYATGYGLLYLPMSLTIFLREFISFNFFLIVLFAMYKKIRIWIYKKRIQKARLSTSS